MFVLFLLTVVYHILKFVHMIMMYFVSLFVSGEPHEHSDNYKIGDCVRPPCKLKRKTDIALEFKFTPGKWTLASVSEGDAMHCVPCIECATLRKKILGYATRSPVRPPSDRRLKYSII
jgi:hypothetical protein